MTKHNVVTQCINWNAARYDRIYSPTLTIDLLNEESSELKKSSSLLEILDAVGDITFVAVGTLWKLGFEEKELTKLILDSGLDRLHTWEITALFTKTIDNLGLDKPKMQDEAAIILGYLLGAITQLDKLGLQHEFIPIFQAIADSNDTKSIDGKTEPHIKANIAKGTYYISPAEALLDIIKANGKVN